MLVYIDTHPFPRAGTELELSGAIKRTRKFEMKMTDPLGYCRNTTE